MDIWTLLLIPAGVIAILAVFVIALVLSARRGGPLAQKVLGKVLANGYAEKVAVKQMDKLLAADDPDSQSKVDEMLDANPELLTQAAAQHGVSPAQMRQAVGQLRNMDPAERAQAMEDVREGRSPAAAGVSAKADPGKSRAQAKKKAKNRAKRKQAKKSRRR